MASKPVVFVIGATGSVGAATVQSLSDKYGDKVEIRAGVRNPDKADKLKGLAGVTVVKATQGDKEELTKVFTSVDRLFINTPPTKDRHELAIRTAEAAKAAGVKHLVAVSVPTADFPDTIFGKQFGALESAIKQLGIPYTFLRLPNFTENFFAFKHAIQNMSTLITFADPTKVSGFVVVADAGRASAEILVNPSNHIDKTYTIVSDQITYQDVAKIFSEALGREITTDRKMYEETKRFMSQMGVPEWIVDGLIEIMKLTDSGSPVFDYSGNTEYKSITGSDPTTVKSWVTAMAESFK